MADLAIERVEQIGLSAARAIAGDAVRALKLRAGVDWSDEPAYYFSFLADPDHVVQVEIGLDISRRILGELIRNGDEAYPYVRLLPQDEWDKR